jgi:DNA-directed RNA polymerase subunit beta
MKETYTSKKRVRKNFGRIEAVMDMPNLIDIQTGSYSGFINNIDAYGEHCEFGLEEVFK